MQPSRERFTCMLRAPCQHFATARIQHKLIIIQQQRAPFTCDHHLCEHVICARANEGGRRHSVTFGLGTSQCHFRARRHHDVTFTRAETSRCHFHTFGDITMSLSRVRRHRDVTFTRSETSRCHFHACGDIAMSLSCVRRHRDVTFARDS